MHIEVTGQGPPLVLLHGWGMHGGYFAPLAQHLRGRFTLHLVDLPGHGASRGAARLALEATAAAVAERVPAAPWLGWSLGGLVALEAARTRPDQVQRLVMLCATPRFVRGPAWPRGMDPALLAGFAAGLERDPRATLERFLWLETRGSAQAREALEQLRRRLDERPPPAPAALRDGLALLADSDLTACLPTLAVPSLWIAGQRDRLVDWRAMQAAAALAPDAAFLRLPGGHAPFLGHPAAVAAPVGDFLAALPA